VNSQVQYLQKQIQRRDAQVRLLLGALDELTVQAELAGSVACAFAWDLAAEEDGYTTLSTEVIRVCELRWSEALEAAEKAAGK
jgi:chromosome segregation ATPase